MKHTGNPHSMPMPSNTPWKSESMPWSMTSTMQNGVMQFSAPNLVSEPFYRRSLNHHKRKSEIIPPLPNKQYISEEKITAHFSGMHISTNYARHSGPSTSNESSMEYDFNNPITQKELEEKLKNANRITVCDEIKKMHAAHSSFIPSALLNRIESPCTALVLWQPPTKLEDLIPGKSRDEYSNNSIDININEEQEDAENNDTTNPNMNYLDGAPTDGMDTDL